MKKNIFLIFILIIVLVELINLILYVNVFLIKKDILDGYFDINDYEEKLDIDIIDYLVPKVHCVKDAKTIANQIWNDVYGEEIGKQNKPYKVYYDFKNNVWLVTGSLKKNNVGGVAHIIVKTNGTIMAIWHES